jgi:hypothetical protein
MVMNKYSPHEAFGKTQVYPAGERLQSMGADLFYAFARKILL